MNAFLSGFDPDTHKPAQKPGFMLLVTANSMGMEGRSLIGPAFRGRLTELSMVEPTRQDLYEIIDAHLPELEGSGKVSMSEDLFQLMQGEKHLSLRQITPNLKEYAEIYAAGLENESVLAMLGG